MTHINQALQILTPFKSYLIEISTTKALSEHLFEVEIEHLLGWKLEKPFFPTLLDTKAIEKTQ